MEQDYSEHVKKIRVVIPLSKKASNGVYRITAVSLNGDGRAMSAADSDIFRYEYTPITPDVPDTGRFLSNLNIATTDYLITGLLVFFATSIIALFLINRKRNR